MYINNDNARGQEYWEICLDNNYILINQIKLNILPYLVYTCCFVLFFSSEQLRIMKYAFFVYHSSLYVQGRIQWVHGSTQVCCWNFIKTMILKSQTHYSKEVIVQVFHIQMLCLFMSVYFLCIMILRHNGQYL